MLHSYFTRDVTTELRNQIAATLKNMILPLPSKPDADENTWVEKMMVVTTYLDVNAVKALERLTGLKGYSTYVVVFLCARRHIEGMQGFCAVSRFCRLLRGEQCKQVYRTELMPQGGIIDGDEKLVKARLSFIINAMASKYLLFTSSAT
jgi:sister-chromatid-cohesion protein PDS5